jgi:hypothetical protein
MLSSALDPPPLCCVWSTAAPRPVDKEEGGDAAWMDGMSSPVLKTTGVQGVRLLLHFHRQPRAADLARAQVSHAFKS